jgi:hypothetical protein
MPKEMMTRLRHLDLMALAFVGFFALTSCAPSLALEDWEQLVPHSGQSLLDQLGQQQVVKMTLTADFDSILLNRNTNDYNPAVLTYEDEHGIDQTYNIKVRPRGKFRRRICDFPPLKLNFSKDDLEAAGLASFDKFKLVTHCLDDAPLSKRLVLREYLAYKMLNELTPNSYRVQLVKITYRDQKNERNKTTRWGFLIEDDDELAARMECEECKNCMGRTAEHFSKPHERIASLFEYMIGNSDWSLRMNRNITLLSRPDGTLVPVPYDFDFSRFVSAPYMRPNSDYQQTGAMERIFMGQAASARELYATIAYFKTKKSMLTDLVMDFKLLNEEERMELVQYLDTFYQDITDIDTAQRAMFLATE